jgi:hypothetical protein
MSIIRRREEIIEHKFYTEEMELSVARYFNFLQNIIVPNISYGAGVHECDILVLKQSGYAYEIEIKISVSDLKADSKKTQAHESNKIKLLYFALPHYLQNYYKYVPIRAGILEVTRRKEWHWDYELQKQTQTVERNYCEIVRTPQVNREAEKWSAEDRINLMRLSTIRTWTLKKTSM